MFPYYLSIGMTYDQYWNDSPSLVRAYKEAEELRQKRLNQQLYLQGSYFYEALVRVSPVLHAFAKKGTKPMEWLDKPYPMNKKDVRQRKDMKEKETFDKGMNKMLAMVKASQEKGDDSEHE